MFVSGIYWSTGPQGTERAAGSLPRRTVERGGV